MIDIQMSDKLVLKQERNLWKYNFLNYKFILSSQECRKKLCWNLFIKIFPVKRQNEASLDGNESFHSQVLQYITNNLKIETSLQ